MLGLFFAIFLFHSILFQARGSDDDLNKLEKKAEAYKKIIDLKKKQQIKIDDQIDNLNNEITTVENDIFQKK